MATIEERADELYCDKDGYVKSLADDYMRLGYIKGATDQKKIDIEKACDLLITALNEGLLETSDIGKLNMWLRKSMEESTDHQKQFDREYLDGKIAQATPKLKDLDADKFLEEIRGSGEIYYGLSGEQIEDEQEKH